MNDEKKREIVSCFNKHKNKNKNKKGNVELEIRLGTGYGLTENDYNNFNKSINNLTIQNKIENEKTLSCVNTINQNRITHFLNDKNVIIKTNIEKKNKIEDWKFKHFKISLNSEEKINKNNNKSVFQSTAKNSNNKNNILLTKCFRYKERQTKFSINSKWKYDFTKVVDMKTENSMTYEEWLILLPKIKNKFLRYEVEIEYISENDLLIQDLGDIIDDIKNTKNYKKLYGDIFKPLFYNSIGSNPVQTTKPVSLEKKDLDVIFNNKYAITEKADGDRKLLRISSNGQIYFTDVKMTDIIKYNKQIKLSSHLWDTIIDGELIKSKTENKEDDDCFYAFNIIMLNGKKVDNMLLPERYKLLEKTINEIGCDNIFIKKFYFPNEKKDLKYYANQILNVDKHPYELDGLIYTPYDPKMREYKWKPTNMLTIDFLIKYCKKYKYDNFIKVELYYGANVKQHKIIKYGFNKNSRSNMLDPISKKGANGVLPLNNNNNSIKFKGDYQPIKFEPEGIACIDVDNVDFTLKDESIIEFQYDKKNPKIYQRWVPFRIRDDKTNDYKRNKKNGKFSGPNDIQSVMGNWKLIQDPVLKKDIM
jgi:hypothetical protein